MNINCDNVDKCDKYNIAFIGAGPANLMGAYYVAKTFPQCRIIILEAGKSSEERDHSDKVDSANGTGGAGLFCDGKFSFCPAGTYIWTLDSSKLSVCYEQIEKLFSEITNSNVPEINWSEHSENMKKNTWILKEYPVIYLDLDVRKKMIKELSKITNVITNCKVINVIDSGHNYSLICKLNHIDSRDEIFIIDSDHVVFGGGRFSPLQIKRFNVEIPMKFKRIEIGVRFEGPSDHPLYNMVKNIDPKFTFREEDFSVEYRTFCWCRNGETVVTDCGSINTWSGRSDCPDTGKSNFGFNVRFLDKSYEGMLKNALNTPVFSLNYGDEVPIEYREIMNFINRGLKSFFKSTGISPDSLHGFKIHGPTIEGVGEYPVTNDNLRIEGTNMWVTGDSNGKFRGIIPSMMSGLFVANEICSEIDMDLLKTNSVDTTNDCDCYEYSKYGSCTCFEYNVEICSTKNIC